MKWTRGIIIHRCILSPPPTISTDTDVLIRYAERKTQWQIKICVAWRWFAHNMRNTAFGEVRWMHNQVHRTYTCCEFSVYATSEYNMFDSLCKVAFSCRFLDSCHKCPSLCLLTTHPSRNPCVPSSALTLLALNSARFPASQSQSRDSCKHTSSAAALLWEKARKSSS